MDRRAARINRIGLALVGLLLIAGGGAALARATGFWGSKTTPLLEDWLRDYPASHSWFWPVVAAAACVLALLGLAWLLAQGRSEKITGLTSDPDEDGSTTTISAKAATSALEEEVSELPGVRRARARMLGSGKHPRLMLTVTYGAQADLNALRRGISDGAVARLRNALDLDTLPTAVRLRLVSGKEHRTVA
ncbi:alkaline shock response membrane anchor protein AmaP [Actinomadura barringtoniae]|uniref:Alkaline shock response membrane anchor protein AmaP n=1 Tax=Actinomadura barringtoniae TaxID=1427535 RepID=A0A939T4W7_9ACTN|nr:alkaline shock response membrane anchor protein AmaP [Actinomadura barringtoniae]MBO2446407.1 alkaline shock response membrane anchor protein AmaP [Actinomadura barringtoniae]